MKIDNGPWGRIVEKGRPINLVPKRTSYGVGAILAVRSALFNSFQDTRYALRFLEENKLREARSLFIKLLAASIDTFTLTAVDEMVVWVSIFFQHTSCPFLAILILSC